MNFRQRVAWLLLAIYLVLTAGVLYYMFEISAQFRMFALDHADRIHTVAANPLRPSVQHNWKLTLETTPSVVKSCITFVWLMLGHVVDIPVPLLAVMIFIVYVQIFCVLWIWTRRETRCLSSCFWPVQLYSVLKSKSVRSIEPVQRDHKSSLSLSAINGTRTTVTYEL